MLGGEQDGKGCECRRPKALSVPSGTFPWDSRLSLPGERWSKLSLSTARGLTRPAGLQKWPQEALSGEERMLGVPQPGLLPALGAGSALVNDYSGRVGEQRRGPSQPP